MCKLVAKFIFNSEVNPDLLIFLEREAFNIVFCYGLGIKTIINCLGFIKMCQIFSLTVKASLFPRFLIIDCFLSHGISRQSGISS